MAAVGAEVPPSSTASRAWHLSSALEAEVAWRHRPAPVAAGPELLPGQPQPHHRRRPRQYEPPVAPEPRVQVRRIEPAPPWGRRQRPRPPLEPGEPAAAQLRRLPRRSPPHNGDSSPSFPALTWGTRYCRHTKRTGIWLLRPGSFRLGDQQRCHWWCAECPSHSVDGSRQYCRHLLFNSTNLILVSLPETGSIPPVILRFIMAPSLSSLSWSQQTANEPLFRQTRHGAGSSQ